MERNRVDLVGVAGQGEERTLTQPAQIAPFPVAKLLGTTVQDLGCASDVAVLPFQVGTSNALRVETALCPAAFLRLLRPGSLSICQRGTGHLRLVADTDIADGKTCNGENEQRQR